MGRAKVVIDLAKVINSEVSGPIEDIIEEQRKIYELFDGWGDGINDQACVAKTKDTQTCFAAFQAADCQNPFGTCKPNCSFVYLFHSFEMAN